MAFSLLGRGGRTIGGSAGGPGSPRFAILAEVRAYWEALRQGSTTLPRRDQIDPRGIAGALEQVFLIERIAPGLARFRLAGMGISDLMGMDVRGMPLSSLFEPAGRARLTGPLEGLFRDGVALDIWLEAERGIGRPAMEARMLLLPLVSTRGITDLALGCLAVEGVTGRAPRRFAISALLNEPVLNKPVLNEPVLNKPAFHKSMLDKPVAGALRVEPVRELAEDQAAFVPHDANRPARGRPHLRLVKSDD